MVWAVKLPLPSFSYQAILSSPSDAESDVHVAVAVHVRRKHRLGPVGGRGDRVLAAEDAAGRRGGCDRDLVVFHLAVGGRAAGAQIAGRAQPEAGVGRRRPRPNSARRR